MKHLVAKCTGLIRHRHTKTQEVYLSLSLEEFTGGGTFSRKKTSSVFSRAQNRPIILSYKYLYHILYQACLESFLSGSEIFHIICQIKTAYHD